MQKSIQMFAQNITAILLVIIMTMGSTTGNFFASDNWQIEEANLHTTEYISPEEEASIEYTFEHNPYAFVERIEPIEHSDFVTFMEFEPVQIEPIIASHNPEIAPNFVEIIFFGNGHTHGEPPESLLVQTPFEFTANLFYENMSAEGHEFSGWFHPESVQVIRPHQTAAILGTGAIHFYAMWDLVNPILFYLQDFDTTGVGIQPLNTLASFQLLAPANNQQVPHSNLTVRWSAVPGALYVMSLRNLNTNALLMDNERIIGTSHVVTQGQLTAGHQFRVAVRASFPDGSFEWRERLFSVAQQQAPNATLSISPNITTWHPSASASHTDIAIITNQPSWNASSSDTSWLNVSSIGGNMIRITTTTNTRPSPNEGFITIDAGSARPVVIGVMQPEGGGQSPNLILTPASWETSSSANSTTFSIITNQPIGNVTARSDSPSWLHVAGTGTTRTISVDPNPSSAIQRRGFIIVSVAGIEREIEVRQNPAGQNQQTVTVTMDINLAGQGVITEVIGAGGSLGGLLQDFSATPVNGHVFLGWFTHQTGGIRVTESTVFPNSTTIFARWTDPVRHMLTRSPSTAIVLNLSEIAQNHAWRPFILAGMSNWTNHAGNSITVGHNNSSNNYVIITPNPGREETISYIASFSPISQSRGVHYEYVIALYDNSIIDAFERSVERGQPNNLAHFVESVMAHEVGHAVGLNDGNAPNQPLILGGHLDHSLMNHGRRRADIRGPQDFDNTSANWLHR